MSGPIASKPKRKNTLHAAAGLLSSQARGASAEVSRALLDSRDRLQLLADVHATISTGLDNSQTVLMPQLLQTLCNALRRSFGSAYHGVSLELTSDPISLPVDDAIAIALLSNETVTNAYKHAFSNESAGAITVRLHRTPERALVLRIADSGVGADLAHAEGDGWRSGSKWSVLHTAGRVRVKSLVARPIAARIVEVSVGWQRHGDACSIVLAETPFAFPAIAGTRQETLRRHGNRRALGAGQAESTVAFPTGPGQRCPGTKPQ